MRLFRLDTSSVCRFYNKEENRSGLDHSPVVFPTLESAAIEGMFLAVSYQAPLESPPRTCRCSHTTDNTTESTCTLSLSCEGNSGVSRLRLIGLYPSIVFNE